MDQEQDFNSSDLEFDDGPPNPFANAGRASIQQMLENAVADRIASKKAVKQLVHVKGNSIFTFTFLQSTACLFSTENSWRAPPKNKPVVIFRSVIRTD